MRERQALGRLPPGPQPLGRLRRRPGPLGGGGRGVVRWRLHRCLTLALGRYLETRQVGPVRGCSGAAASDVAWGVVTSVVPVCCVVAACLCVAAQRHGGGSGVAYAGIGTAGVCVPVVALPGTCIQQAVGIYAHGMPAYCH